MPQTLMIGSWHLHKWTCEIDGQFHNYPFGEDAQGIIIYGADGYMSAILSRANRQPFDKPNLVLGTDEEKIAAVSGYVSYAGRWRVEDNKVIHQVTHSLLPNWVGTDLVRTISWQDNKLLLSTEPERTSSGKAVVNHLYWERNE